MASIERGFASIWIHSAIRSWTELLDNAGRWPREGFLRRQRNRVSRPYADGTVPGVGLNTSFDVNCSFSLTDRTACLAWRAAVTGSIVSVHHVIREKRASLSNDCGAYRLPVCLCRLRRSNGGRRAVQRDALKAYRLFQIDRTGQTSSETSLALPPFANSARPSLAALGKIWSVMTARP
jgi:hypothetical protein